MTIVHTNEFVECPSACVNDDKREAKIRRKASLNKPPKYIPFNMHPTLETGTYFTHEWWHLEDEFEKTIWSRSTVPIAGIRVHFLRYES